MLSTLPGSRAPSPIQLIDWLYRPLTYLERCRERYGDTFRVNFLGFGEGAVFSDPEHIREIFTAPPDILAAGRANAVLGAFLGSNSLLVLDGPDHLSQRRLMSPPFHGERMTALVSSMQMVVDRFVQRWPRGGTISVHHEMQRITLDIITRAIMGSDDEVALDAFRRAVTPAIEGATKPYMLSRFMQYDLGPYSPWGRFLRQRKEADDVLHAQIARLRREGTEGRTDILSTWLEVRDEDGRQLRDDEIRDQMRTLLVAGHETTATTLSWVFDLLLRKPAVVARLKEEIRKVAPDGRPTAAQLSELEYASAIIDEAMRLYPVAPAVVRSALAPITIGGVSLEPDQLAVASVYLVHRRPELYPNPNEFRPERWLGQRRNPYSFIPFGGGGRRCLGRSFAIYEMLIVLARVFAELDLELVSWDPPAPIRRGPTMGPRGGVPVRILARNN